MDCGINRNNCKSCFEDRVFEKGLDIFFSTYCSVVLYSMTKLHTFLKSSNVNLKEKTVLLHFNPLTIYVFNLMHELPL